MNHERDTDLLPLSFGQERLWLLDWLGSQARDEYLLPVAWRVLGALDLGVLVGALAAVVRRHDVLRTRFVVDGGVPRAVVDPFGAGDLFDVEVVDAPGGGVGSEGVQALVDRELARPFDLEWQWPVRCRVIRCSPEVHVVLAVFHHIACDGWSLSVFARDLGELYEAAVGGRQPELPALPWTYAEFARQQRQVAGQGGLQEGLRYWAGQLAGSTPTELPSLLSRPQVWSSVGATRQFVLDAVTAERLRQLARSHRASLFMVLLAGFFVAVHQLTGETDLVVGTPIAGRDRPETVDVLGFFVNTLPLRIRLDPQTPFGQLLDQVRTCCLEAYAHADVPFDKIVEAVNPPRDLSRNPLFQLMFSLDTGMTADLRLVALQVNKYPVLVHSPMFDSATEARAVRGEPLTVTVNYAASVLDRYDADALCRRIRHTFSAMVDWDKGTSIHVPLDADELTAIRQFEAGTASMPPIEGGDVVAWFDSQVAYDGARPAVVEQGKTVTYGELQRVSGLVSDWLTTLALAPSSVIGIAHDRGFTQVALILGVLRAGMAYLPLDPREPAAVLAASTTAASAILVFHDTGEVAAKLGGRQSAVSRIEGIGSEATFLDSSAAGCDLVSRTAQLAYVIRTSGSTGEPKAVAVPLDALSNRVAWGIEHFAHAESDRLLYKTAPTFDAAQWEVFGTLCSGATLVIAPPGVEADPNVLGSLVRSQQVTLLQLVPTVLRLILDTGVLRDCSSLRWVSVAGEVLTADDVSRFADQSGAQLTNTYGPSECAIDVTAWDAGSGEDSVVPIGRPISGVSVQLVDRQHRRVPTGAVGQIAIGGLAVGWGYLNQAATTAACFVPDADGVGARQYLTGDLGRWGPDGNLYFIGRAEAEIKVNGVRTNLAGIEAVTLRCDAVRTCAVLVTPAGDNFSELSLFWTGQREDEQHLKAFLRENLSMAFRPRNVVYLDGALPRLPSGKIDRKRLSALVVDRVAPAAAGADRLVELAGAGGLAGHTAAVWRGLLRDENVNVEDDFFASGGTSLQAVSLAHQLSVALQRDVTPRDIYQSRTIAGLVSTLTERGAPDQLSAPHLTEPVSSYEPSFGQERLWLLDWLGSQARDEYLLPVAWRVLGALDLGVLVGALAAVVRRHDVLRTRFVVDGGVPRAVVDPFGAGDLFDVEVVDAPGGGVGSEGVQALVDRELARPFDLEWQWPVRCRVIRCSPEVHVVLAVFHHIACDGWSLSVFARDLGELYEAAVGGRQPELPALPWTYAEFARQQRQVAGQGGLQEGLRYWAGQLAGSTPTELPSLLSRPQVWSSVGATRQFVLDAVTAERLRQLARSHRASLFMVLLAGFFVAVHQLTGETDLVVGTPIAGRDRPETVDVLGFFVNTLPLRIRLDPQTPFGQLLDQVRTCCLEAYAHADVPFDKIVEAVNPPRDLSRNPLFQLMFSMEEQQGPETAPSASATLNWSTEDVVAAATKFDATVTVVESAGALRMDVIGATSVLTDEETQALIDAFVAALTAI